MAKRALVVGFFSLEAGKATAGDLLARDVLIRWIAEAGIDFDVALPPSLGGVNLWSIDPSRYTHLIFVCGPCMKSPMSVQLAARFARCKRIGLNLSMIEDIEVWNPFHVVFERDSNRAVRPDITLCAPQTRVPLTGVILVHPQSEYGARGRYEDVAKAIADLLNGKNTAAVPIDTMLPRNAGGLRSPAEVESLIARMDVVITTRLHGMVLALKNGVPAVAIDPIAGGAKVLKQAAAVGWTTVFTADALSAGELSKAFDYCLTEDARRKASSARERALLSLAQLKNDLVQAVRT